MEQHPDHQAAHDGDRGKGNFGRDEAQNDRRLPKGRREREFAALIDEEAAQIEAICKEVFDDGGG
ncbi:MAG: hypothetical protein OXG16_11480 [Rhodospirillales bacterium]|nr:hypothetical protein [Rhodospirillales bacterium]